MHRWLLAFACAMACSSSFAQTLPPSVIACADEPDSLKRLVCYDKEVSKYRNGATARQPAAASAHPPAASASPPPASPPASSFGSNAELERKSKPVDQPPPIQKVTVHVAAVSFKPTGETVLTLDDGQVWEETEHNSHIPLRAGEEVTIKKGVLGAFYLSSPEARGLRVRRVK